MSVRIPLLLLAVLLVSCHGAFDDIYDDPSESAQVSEGQLYVEATNWKEWHYLDFNTANELTASGGASSPFVRMAIPEPDGQSTTEKSEQSTTEENGQSTTEESGQSTTGESGQSTTEELGQSTTENEESSDASDTSAHAPGIYTYWYDVFGEGLSRYEFRSYAPTAPQPEPATWHIAIHRNNVRTNGGEVYETDLTDFAQLPESSSAFADKEFVSDTWNERDVWTEQGQMLQGLIGNQGLEINPLLSSWLTVSLPPVPPTFSLNNHVFVVRFPDNTYAALQLVNYQNAAGVKCCLTFNYKYPY